MVQGGPRHDASTLQTSENTTCQLERRVIKTHSNATFSKTWHKAKAAVAQSMFCDPLGRSILGIL